MGISTTQTLAIVFAAGIVLAGCQSSRLGALQTQPTPLPASPSGTVVTSGQLPPPTQPDGTQIATTAQVDENGFPIAPTNPDSPTLTTDTDSSIQQVAAAGPVTKESVLGRWVTQTGGGQCDVFLSLTKWSAGFRAASRGCPGDAASISSWNLNGNQVVLYDTNGNQLATLFKGAGKQLSGQTRSGTAITMSQS